MKKIATLVLFLAFVAQLQAQEFKFGISASPSINFLTSNSNDQEGTGSNLAFQIAVNGEYYFGDGANYALTGGLGFSLGRGGALTYEDGGVLLPNTELDEDNFTNNAGMNPMVGETEELELTANTQIKYRVNYFDIPLGFKMRTNELGGSYIRGFAHLPVLNIGIPIVGRGDVTAPEEGRDALIYGGTSENENIYRDVFPIALNLGAGIGVEWAPNDEEGVVVTGGFYYESALLDLTKQIQLRQGTGLQEENPLARIQMLTLRIGVLF